MLYYVGIDPSITNTGIVVLDTSGDIVTAYEPSKLLNEEAKSKYDLSHKIFRYKAISDFVRNKFNRLTLLDKLIIGYEDYSYASINKSYTIGEFGGVLKLSLLNIGCLVRIHFIPPTVVKYFATGNGSATKKMMVSRFNKDHDNLSNNSHDLVDAYFLAEMVGYLDNKFPVNSNQINELTRHKLSIISKYEFEVITNYL